jgi:poly(3-hydroxybutyrate) depolymerase
MYTSLLKIVAFQSRRTRLAFQFGCSMLLLLVCSCAMAWSPLEAPCVAGSGFADCAVPGWPDRPYTAYRPSAHTLTNSTPVVLVLHGGTGNAQAGIDMSCPDGDRSNRACWHQVAERFGFVVVVPNGTRTTAGSPQRVWNAGGGSGGWQCVSGTSCLNNVDDMAYLRAVLDHTNRWMHVNQQAVFATGLSNGAALAHRMACEMADRVTAVAPVGGANQFETNASCLPSKAVGVLQIHGTADPCWTYSESSAACLSVLSGRKIGVEASTSSWAMRHRCQGAPTTRALLDQDGDGVRVDELTWSGCAAPVQLARIINGGHTYPDGRQYASAVSIGPTLREWGAERIWAWFAAAANLDKTHLTAQWWTPGEGGWGLSIVQQGDVLVPIWFTYDASGMPIWLIGSGLVRQADGSYLGELLRATGVPFNQIANQPSLRGFSQVGSIRLTPRADGRMLFDYVVDGAVGMKLIERLVPGPNPTCLASSGSRAQARNATDKWWNPAESGWGMQLSEYGDNVFFSWYTYAQDGAPMWIAGALERTSGRRFAGPLLRPDRGIPLSQINAQQATSFPLPTVGNAVIEIIDGETARFEFTLDGVSRQRTIRRFEFSGPTRTECN